MSNVYAELEEQGYCLFEGLLDPAECEGLDAKARALMEAGEGCINERPKGYVKLEGALNQIPELAPLCAHPMVMEIAEHVLGSPFYVVNNGCMMWCQCGSLDGRLHSDWPLGDVRQPYPAWPMLFQTMWMLTDFTPENGATRLVPGSHRSGRPPDREGDDVGELAAVGPKGSLLVWYGGIWHRNGPNTSGDQHRMGASFGYIPKYVHRPLDGWPLVRRDLYERFPDDLKQLLERSVE